MDSYQTRCLSSTMLKGSLMNPSLFNNLNNYVKGAYQIFIKLLKGANAFEDKNKI